MAVVDHITACPLDCPDTCSLTVSVTDGRITKVDAAPGNPFTDGFICHKVKHHAQRVYAPERVMTPLIRTGPKGSGEFRCASWAEALDLVVDRLRTAEATTGPESVVPYTYNSSAPALQHEVGERFWRRFGASRVHHTVCAATYTVAYYSLFGSMLSADPRDVIHSRLIVIWGANPTVSNTHFPPLVTRAQREFGAKVVSSIRGLPQLRSARTFTWRYGPAPTLFSRTPLPASSRSAISWTTRSSRSMRTASKSSCRLPMRTRSILRPRSAMCLPRRSANSRPCSARFGPRWCARVGVSSATAMVGPPAPRSWPCRC